MGVVQSKKDGVIKKYQLKIDLNAEIKNDFLEFVGWSFPQIKEMYAKYTRLTECPLIDFFIFHKIIPSGIKTNRYIFQQWAQNGKYLNIYELICILILTSFNSYRKKLQFMFVLFDFKHNERLTNRQLIFIFQNLVYGFCRFTGQDRPKYQYLARYSIQRFIRVNTLQALEKIVTYRRLIEEVQGNNDIFQIFKRFQKQQYSYIHQQAYLFRVNQYKKYQREDIDKIYRIVKKVNLQKNFEEVQIFEKNRLFRLQNRKINCIKQLLQSKQSKFLSTNRNYSLVASTSRLPNISNYKQSQKSSRQSIIKSSTKKHLTSNNPQKKQRKILFLNGKVESKQDIFQTIKYFKNLSSNKQQIKIKQFFKNFQKKAFMKKQISSLFKHFDINKKGEVSFQTFLKVYYNNIEQQDIKVIKQWYEQFKQIYEADHFDISQLFKKKQKKNIQLPKNTLKRIDQIFNSIDQQKKGYLNLQNLKKAYNTGFTIKQLEDMIKQFGQGNKIYKHGFIKMTLPQDWTIQGTQYVGV